MTPRASFAAVLLAMSIGTAAATAAVRDDRPADVAREGRGEQPGFRRTVPPIATPAPPSAPNPFYTAALSAAAALIGSLVGFLSARASSRATIVQKTNELEIEVLDRRLSEFVGPFMQLSEENRILAEELKRRQGKGDFRTLTALLTPGWRTGLSKGEVKLLEVVVRNGTELRRLLMEKGSAMVSPVLTPFFSRASTHFRFLQLAYDGSLDEDAARYSAYVYPRELDGIMEAERQRLEQRRELLRSNPYTAHPRMPDLLPPAPGTGLAVPAA